MNDASHIRRVCFLYKTILRLHRGLPPELNNLGTAYVKDEFRRHKTCDPPTAMRFLASWTDYALTIAQQLGVKGPKTSSKLGVDINETHLNDMSSEQIAQLYELYEAIKVDRQSSA